MPTYSVTPEFSFDTRDRGKAQRSPVHAGSVVGTALEDQKVRTWGHAWNNASSATVSSLDTLWDSTGNGASTMDWTPPAPSGESAIKVRFLKYEKRRLTAVRWNIRVELEEAHGI